MMVTGTGTDGAAPCRLIRTAPLRARGPDLALHVKRGQLAESVDCSSISISGQ